MAVGDIYVFPGFLKPVLTQLFFRKPPTTFLTYFCRGEWRKFAGKKSRLNGGSNSQPPGHKSDMLTTEPPMTFGETAFKNMLEKKKMLLVAFSPFSIMFSILPKTKLIFSHILLFAEAFNLHECRILFFL